MKKLICGLLLLIIAIIAVLKLKEDGYVIAVTFLVIGLGLFVSGGAEWISSRNR